MHNCEDGDENESVSLDAALSAASKNQGNLLKGNDNNVLLNSWSQLSGHFS